MAFSCAESGTSSISFNKIFSQSYDDIRGCQILAETFCAGFVTTGVVITRPSRLLLTAGSAMQSHNLLMFSGCLRFVLNETCVNSLIACYKINQSGIILAGNWFCIILLEFRSPKPACLRSVPLDCWVILHCHVSGHGGIIAYLSPLAGAPISQTLQKFFRTINVFVMCVGFIIRHFAIECPVFTQIDYGENIWIDEF